MKRVAVLYDEQGQEIYRGPPANMPVRFVEDNDEVVLWTMAQAVEAGTPISEFSGDDLPLHEEDL